MQWRYFTNYDSRISNRIISYFRRWHWCGQMGLTIKDFEGRYEASSPSELESVLCRKYGRGVNGFWLSHGVDRNPALALLVNGDLATLTCFPRESHCRSCD